MSDDKVINPSSKSDGTKENPIVVQADSVIRSSMSGHARVTFNKKQYNPKLVYFDDDEGIAYVIIVIDDKFTRVCFPEKDFLEM